MEHQSPFLTRDPGRTKFQSWRPLPFLLCVLLLIPAVGMSQDPVSEEDLQREWLVVQKDKDRRAKKNWWRQLDPAQLNAFIEGGVEVNASDRRGWTPLHSAARYNSNPKVLTALLNAGADVSARDRAGDTPLHWAAAENANVAIVTALIAAGADVNSRDRFGWLPIHTAAETSSNPEIIEALLDAGSKRNKRAYFLFFRPAFLLKHNSEMSESDKKLAMALLKESE